MYIYACMYRERDYTLVRTIASNTIYDSYAYSTRQPLGPNIRYISGLFSRRLLVYPSLSLSLLYPAQQPYIVSILTRRLIDKVPNLFLYIRTSSSINQYSAVYPSRLPPASYSILLTIVCTLYLGQIPSKRSRYSCFLNSPSLKYYS